MGAYTSVNVLLDINGNSMPKHGNSMPIYGISMPIHGNMLIYYLLHLGFIIYKEHNLELIYASGLKCDHMMKLGIFKIQRTICIYHENLRRMIVNTIYSELGYSIQNPHRGSINSKWISSLETFAWNIYTLCGRFDPNIAQRVFDFHNSDDQKADPFDKHTPPAECLP